MPSYQREFRIHGNGNFKLPCVSHLFSRLRIGYWIFWRQCKAILRTFSYHHTLSKCDNYTQKFHADTRISHGTSFSLQEIFFQESKIMLAILGKISNIFIGFKIWLVFHTNRLSYTRWYKDWWEEKCTYPPLQVANINLKLSFSFFMLFLRRNFQVTK